jgi:hypothetical protein
MEVRDPIPIRASSEWVQLAAFNSLAAPTGMKLLMERAKVVCRECIGFGHARTNCPTRRKLTEMGGLSPYIKSAVGQYRQIMNA